MNIITEDSIAAWVRSLADFSTIQVNAGQSEEEKPNDRPVIYVVCTGSELEARAFYKANVQIIISTPEIIVDDLSIHTALVDKMKSNLKNALGIGSFFPNSCKLRGLFLHRWNEGQDEDSRQAAVELTASVHDLDI